MSQFFVMPHQIVFGSDALSQGCSQLSSNVGKALIVTDKNMVKFGNTAKLESALLSRGVNSALFADVDFEPTDTVVQAGIAVFKREKCDAVVALGGGSALDAAKIIVSFAHRPQVELRDFMGKEINWPRPKLVAVPTTAGTGSEATKFCVITDTQRQVKMLLTGSSFMPDLAILDPMFTLTAPLSVTVNTGVDALTHAVEAFTSRKAQPLSDTFAVSAVRRIMTSLPKVCRDWLNLDARTQMALAATEAGIAFNNSSVTLVHGMSRPLGALFHVPHGLSNAVLLGPCLQFALQGAQERFAELSRACNIADASVSESVAAARFVEAVIALLRGLKVPNVQGLHICRKQYFDSLNKMAGDALISGSPQNTRRVPLESDLIDLYIKAWDF